MFFSPFSIAIISFREERANLSAFRTFVRFVLVWICRFPLPLGVWEGLQFVIVALPGPFSYLFFLNPAHTLLLTFPSFRPVGMVSETCLPSNAYNLSSGANVCWSEHSDSSFNYGFMSLDYGLGTMTSTTTCISLIPVKLTFIWTPPILL